MFISTRDDKNKKNSIDAILCGLASDGGLFVPEEIKRIDNIYSLKDDSYIDLANTIISSYFVDLDKNELKKCIEEAYQNTFDDKEITPLVKKGDYYFLELFHGPTSAFKDVALSFLPRIMSLTNRLSNNDKKIVILTATSGDTGKAALEGFKDVEGTMIKVLYPHKMVSMVQERQMATSKGNNVEVLAVKGNFDDCQRLVKHILENKKFNKIKLSSANSINIGRLIPQIVYYFKAYYDLLNKNEIKKDELIDFIVPTGNFGDILAGYMAKCMGLPINKLVAASNINDVLTKFFETGEYNANRELYNTISPSIDILVSSNLERLLYFKSKDAVKVKQYMDDLKKNRDYKIDKEMLEEIKKDFVGISADIDETKKVIKDYFEKYDYLIDTHTAVALACANKYESPYKKVILSTASPFKFAKDVYECISGEKIEDNLEAMNKLQDYSKKKVPKNLAILKDLEVRFKEVIGKEDVEKLCQKLEEC